jgi:hypothetical protein
MAKQLREANTEEAREEALVRELRAAPRCNGIATLEPVALELRRIWATHFPHMEAIFREAGYAI